MAYASSSPGSTDVYVESFPPGTFKRQISSGGGGFPRWRRDGKELYFTSDARDGTIRLMASTVRETGAGLEFTPAETLFEDVVIQSGSVAGHTGNHHVYAVDPHGQRFLLSIVGTPEAPPGPAPLTVIVNWQSALSAREKP